MTGKLSAPPLLTNIEIETWDALVSRILTLNERAWEDGLNTTQIQSWLENFQGFTGAPMDRERLHALYMLSQFMYFGSKEIKVLLKAIYRELYLLPLVSKVKDANRHLTQFQAALTAAMTSTRFLGLGNASESGPLLLYPFRQENELKKKQFLEVGEIYKTDNAGVRVPADTSITRYVFIDDICGSGDTASKFSTRELLELAAAPGVELYYFSMFATKDGLDFVKKNTVFGQNADAIFELDESYKWTHSRSRYMSVMPLGIDENLLRNMATTYGSQIDRSWPLGWNNDELLIGFKHNTPDNTLPVIWSSLQNGSQRSWYPVFNRFPKV